MSDSDRDASQSNTMRGRAPGSGLKVWLLMDADRRLVTGALLLLVFVVLVAVGVLDPVALRKGMSVSDPAETLFQALTGAIITGVTLVVTIVQLVLSQELGPAGDQRERMEGALAFRRDAEDVLDDAPVAPAEPSAFLYALLDASITCAQRLKEAAQNDASDDASGNMADDAAERVSTYVDDLVSNAQAAQEQVEGTEFGTFDVLSAALGYNYSWKIYEARSLRAKYDLSARTDAALEDVLETLRVFGPAREHFKTLYFEWSLTDLSRSMIYVAVPALLVAVVSILYLGNPESVVGQTLGVANTVWIVSAAVTVAVSPFMLLLSYVLRIATVAKRTLAIGPFVLRETDRTADFG